MDMGGAKVMYWFADTKTPYMGGGFGATALLSRQTGLTDAFPEVRDDFVATGWETVVDRDPDILVLGDLQRDRFPGDRLQDKIDFLKSDPLTRDLTAVKEDRMVALHGAELNPSIRFVDGLEKIRAWWDARGAEL